MILIGYVCAVYVSEATKKHQLLNLNLPTVIGRVSQIDPKYEAMMGEMQLLMLAGWLQRKRGTSGCSGGWFQTIIGTLHYLKCI